MLNTQNGHPGNARRAWSQKPRLSTPQQTRERLSKDERRNKNSISIPKAHASHATRRRATNRNYPLSFTWIPRSVQQHCDLLLRFVLRHAPPSSPPPSPCRRLGSVSVKTDHVNLTVTSRGWRTLRKNVGIHVVRRATFEQTLTRRRNLSFKGPCEEMKVCDSWKRLSRLFSLSSEASASTIVLL